MLDETKSLEQLENDIWTDDHFPTGLVEKCHRYRKIPIKDLTVEQLRVLIGQNIGLLYLIPKAIDVLKNDLLIEGDLYPGDLLTSVLDSDKNYWLDHPAIKEELTSLIKVEKEKMEQINESYFRKHIKKIDVFLNS